MRVLQAYLKNPQLCYQNSKWQKVRALSHINLSQSKSRKFKTQSYCHLISAVLQLNNSKIKLFSSPHPKSVIPLLLMLFHKFSSKSRHNLKTTRNSLLTFLTQKVLVKQALAKVSNLKQLLKSISHYQYLPKWTLAAVSKTQSRQMQYLKIQFSLSLPLTIQIRGTVNKLISS